MKVLAPSSSRWLEAVASYGSAISPPPSNENATGGTAAAGVKLHRQQPAGAPAAASSESGGGSGSSGSSGRKGVVELVDSAPLQKYGVRLYTIAVSGYVQSQSDGADYQGGASFHFTQTISGPTQGNASFYPDRLRTTARKWRFHLGVFGFASSGGCDGWLEHVRTERAAEVRNTLTFCAIYIQNRSFHQDRLGTNIGKTPKQQVFRSRG